MPWLFTRYQAAASEVPRLNDDNAASAATRDEEHAVSHLKRASRHRPADRFLEGLKMRSPVVNRLLIPNKKKTVQTKRDKPTHSIPLLLYSPNKQDACKTKNTNKKHLLHSFSAKKTITPKKIPDTWDLDLWYQKCKKFDWSWWRLRFLFLSWSLVSWSLEIGRISDLKRLNLLVSFLWVLVVLVLMGFQVQWISPKNEAMSATSSGRVERPCKRNIDGFHEIKWNW